MKLLELFSGTHSIGKVAKERNIEVVSLDRDLPADIQEDIMTWNYKIYPEGYFDIITASPVCLWWSRCRQSWIGKKIKAHGDKIITKEILQEDINKYGKPMVDKVREIINYFKPKYYWIENPQTGSMKYYIVDIPYYDVDYCMYSDWGYKKRTRFWTNIKGFNNKLCKNNCKNIIEIKKENKKVRKLHIKNCGNTESINIVKKYAKDVNKDFGGRTTKLDRYRIPPKLINELLNCCK